MKGLFCANCGDIRGLLPDSPVVCLCRRCYGRWSEPHIMGRALFMETTASGAAISPAAYLSVLGFHNGFLVHPHPVERHAVWKDADGYLFKQYESPVVRFNPGSSSDTRLVPKAVFNNGVWLPDEELAQAWKAVMV